MNAAFAQSVTYSCSTANDGVVMYKGLRLHFRFEVNVKAGKNTQHQVKNLYVFFPKG